MNKDQVKGSIKETTGKAQQQLGKAVGSEKQQLKGAAREVERYDPRLVQGAGLRDANERAVQRASRQGAPQARPDGRACHAAGQQLRHCGKACLRSEEVVEAVGHRGRMPIGPSSASGRRS